MTVTERIRILADEKNADFVSRLTPGIARENILGVRMPQARALARELRGTPESAAFLASLPHETLDENTLHALLLNDMRDYEALLKALGNFLPCVDNWLTCDALRPRAVKRRLTDFRQCIDSYLDSGHAFTVRFGIEMLMCYYLDEHFDVSQLERVAANRLENYYVRMMQAWYFATSLAKQYDSTIIFLEERRLDRWTHNKTIQKAIESFRISDERKRYLRTLRY